MGPTPDIARDVRPSAPQADQLSQQELLDMHPPHHVMIADALIRQQELQAAAERRRVLRDDSEARVDVIAVGPLAGLRRAVGTLLVLAGERVRGAQRAATRPAAGAHR